MATFAPFMRLPPELRLMIYDEAIEAQDDIVEVVFYARPEMRRRRPPAAGAWQVVWAYKCRYRKRPDLLDVSVESRVEYIKRNQDFLQLNRQEPVYFKAAWDTVYFDAESFYTLWHYVKIHRAQMRTILFHNFRGFNLIQTLGSPFGLALPAAAQNIMGLFDLRVPAQRTLTGLTNIRLLGMRGIPPCGLQPVVAPTIQRLRICFIGKLQNYLTSRQFTQAQQNRINAAMVRVMADTTAFVAVNNAGPLGLPVT
jgi:2EXR family